MGGIVPLYDIWAFDYHAVFHQTLPGSQISVAVAYKRFKHGFFSFTYRKYIKVHVHRYENLLIPKHHLGTRFSSCSKLAIMILFITYCPMILQLYKVHCQATCTCTESCIMESSAVVLEQIQREQFRYTEDQEHTRVLVSLL